MGKGYHGFMHNKDFHPSSARNVKLVWEAQQRQQLVQQRQLELATEREKEEEMCNNRALLGDEKARLGLSFMYDPPKGINQMQPSEPKFEWQRKFNAPREAWARGEKEWKEFIVDQPFGIAVNHVRCLRCKTYGHSHMDRAMCALYDMSGTLDDRGERTTPSSIVRKLRATRRTQNEQSTHDERMGGVLNRKEMSAIFKAVYGRSEEKHKKEKSKKKKSKR